MKNSVIVDLNIEGKTLELYWRDFKKYADQKLLIIYQYNETE